MNFELTDRAKDYLERVTAFMDERIYPAEPVYDAQMHESGDPNFHPPVIEELKADARAACGTCSTPSRSGAPD
jgi:acyl-CoA dehydrogenase